MRDPYPVHGRRWSWRHFRWVCRCGLDAYPCIVLVTRQRQARWIQQHNAGAQHFERAR